MTLPRDIVRFEDNLKCPNWDTDVLAAAESKFDQNCDKRLLECALGILRDALPAPVHRGDLPARICFLLADREKNSKRRENLAAEGVRWAEIAVSQGAGLNGAVHYYLAVNLGLAVYGHTALAVKNLKRISAQLQKAVQLSPNVDSGGPYRVLGMLYLLAPPWPQGVGDGDKAIKLLTKVTKYYPGHPLNHVFLARALWEIEEEDALDRVRAQLEIALKLIRQDRFEGPRRRWLKEVREVAEDAELKAIVKQTQKL
ncbi:MAG TPA: hypothetical protein VM425_06630 [Myxococcota bacterium]|nr:hypothetical protein [Myxococcota bacterium]